MKLTSKIAMAGLALAFAAGSGFAATATENWDNNCASCHGPDGKGQTKMGKKLKVQDYTDAKVQAGFTDDDLVKAILDGVKDKETGKERMKGFKDEIPAAEAKDLVAHIRSFKA